MKLNAEKSHAQTISKLKRMPITNTNNANTKEQGNKKLRRGSKS